MFNSKIRVYDQHLFLLFLTDPKNTRLNHIQHHAHSEVYRVHKRACCMFACVHTCDMFSCSCAHSHEENSAELYSFSLLRAAVAISSVCCTCFAAVGSSTFSRYVFADVLRIPVYFPRILPQATLA